MTKTKRLFNLDSKEYEHPFDREALKKVKAIPGLSEATKFVLKWTYVQWKVVALCGSNFHVTQTASPDLYSIAANAIQTLDLQKIPEVYVEQDYYINAYTTGYNGDAFISLSNGAVDKLTDEELVFVVGHEAGHVKSDHVVYHVMLAYLTQLASNSVFSGAFKLAIQPPLAYWNRMSEFTADRAGLLACQDLEVALSAIMKMSGLPVRYYESAKVKGFLEQAREFDQRYGGTLDELIKDISLLLEDHPWTILRAAELVRWIDSGEYQHILDSHHDKICPTCGSHIPQDSKKCPFCSHLF